MKRTLFSGLFFVEFPGNGILASMPAWCTRSEEPLPLYSAWPSRDGTMERNFSSVEFARGRTDRGDSGLFKEGVYQGHYSRGDGLREGNLSPNFFTGPMESHRAARLRSTSARQNRHPSPRRAQRYIDPDTLHGHYQDIPMYAAAAPQPRVETAAPRMEPVAAVVAPSELEILIGWPQWMPEGASAVYVTAETDAGEFTQSERMHASQPPSTHGRDGLGGALLLPGTNASSVTLHVMAEYGGGRFGPPSHRGISVGGTTIKLPESTVAARPSRRLLELLAPLDISVELGYTTEAVPASARPPSVVQPPPQPVSRSEAMSRAFPQREAMREAMRDARPGPMMPPQTPTYDGWEYDQLYSQPSYRQQYSQPSYGQEPGDVRISRPAAQQPLRYYRRGS